MVVPRLLQFILWTAAGISALGVIYYKGVRPLANFIAAVEEAVPVLKTISEKLNDPNLVDVIVAMAKQFQTNSGSSLRDVVNRLEVASVEASHLSEILRVTMEGSRQLQESERAQVARLLVLLEHVQLQANTNTERIMDASDLAAGLAADVATELKDSHERASNAGDIPGESADAFSTRPEGGT